VPVSVSTLELDLMRSGDEAAIAAVWRRCNPLVVRYLRARRCTDADDVAAQVWLEVARGLRRFDGDGDAFGRWLFTLAHRRLIDSGRRRGRRRESPVAEVPERGDERGPEQHEPLAAALELLRRLPPAQADAVALRVLGGFSPEEVGQILDRSPGAVRVLTHRGLARLRQILSAEAAAAAPGGVTRRARPTLTTVDD
jgi:RNA polymerase sigma-70 factor (ECF subfamily)